LMVCHGRLATKDRLCKFGGTTDGKCCFCSKDESLNHLFFGCSSLKIIWHKVLSWMRFDHAPLELRWITRGSKGNGWKTLLLKSVVVETIYTLWKYRNDVCFGNRVHNTNIEEDIINTIYSL
jgi:hypothetical protein